MQNVKLIKAVPYIARIAMKEDNDPPGVFVRQKPGVQFMPLRFERDILIGQSTLPGSGGEDFHRKKNGPGLNIPHDNHKRNGKNDEQKN